MFDEQLELLADYFNLNKSEVLPPTPDDYEDEFQVKLPYHDEFVVLEVVTKSVAKSNELDFCNGDKGRLKAMSSKQRIGLYKRLNKSDYYWRWL